MLNTRKTLKRTALVGFRFDNTACQKYKIPLLLVGRTLVFISTRRRIARVFAHKNSVGNRDKFARLIFFFGRAARLRTNQFLFVARSKNARHDYIFRREFLVLNLKCKIISRSSARRSFMKFTECSSRTNSNIVSRKMLLFSGTDKSISVFVNKAINNFIYSFDPVALGAVRSPPISFRAFRTYRVDTRVLDTSRLK